VGALLLALYSVCLPWVRLSGTGDNSAVEHAIDFRFSPYDSFVNLVVQTTVGLNKKKKRKKE
jgi:hypothetical protein